jgi:hypothetical protein
MHLASYIQSSEGRYSGAMQCGAVCDAVWCNAVCDAVISRISDVEWVNKSQVIGVTSGWVSERAPGKVTW